MLRAHLRLLGLLPVVLLAMVLFAVPAAAQEYHQEYQSQDLATGADDYRQELQQSVPRAKKQPWLIQRLRRDADAEYRAKRYSQAIDDLQKAIAFGADDGLVWLRLAQALAGTQNDHVRLAAYNAYRKSSDPVERGEALFLIARDYDRHQQFKDALAVFQAGLRLTQSAAVAERVEQLRRLVAFRVIKVELAAEAESPRVCLRFNEKIAARPDLHYGDYVHTTPELGGIVTARGDTLCLNGLKHGENYDVELLAGFPAETSDKTIDPWQTRVVVPDRKPSLSFAGTGYVLPREGSAGLPLTSINVDKVRVRLVRINERNLVPSINADKLTMSFDPSDVEDLIEQSGSLVWKGEMAISGERNRPVVTAIPVAPILRDKGPGVFLAVVDRSDRKPGEERTPASNWVLVSNLGLTAYTGKDGMDVMVRSLADAKPMADVMVRLFARNNGELTSLKTDASGIAHIEGGLLHGSGGDEPFAVMAYGPANDSGSDFNFLEVGRAAFDLSDRGVSGRPPPGPVDGYLYTDRGIYRPGEDVHLTVLARDDKAMAASDLPLTLRLIRPDGVEVERRRLTGGKLGAFAETLSLARDARIGSWRAELKLDPKAPAIGSIEFRVEDFVPPTLKIALSAADQPVRPSEPFPVEVAANYYYGAPGAGLAVQAQATIAIDADPFPGEPGFRFGLEDDEFAGSTQDLEAAATDDAGKSTLTLNLKDLPAGLTKPLAATINVSVFEPSGREVADTLTRPIRTRPLAIGLHSPSGSDAVGEGQPAVVEIIALDNDGKRTAAKGLHWELLRERWSYSWYSTNGRWRHRTQRRDEPVEAGIIDTDRAKPVTLSRTLPAGHYRWEAGDAASGAQTSLRFQVGWYVEAALPDVPDKLTATLDKKTYQPGETAKLFVKAPFAGEAELAIATDRVVSLRSLSLPADGRTIEIPVDAAWGSGAYALVSAYRPQNAAAPGAGAAAPRGPGRAVGVAWLGVDPAPRTLAVSLAQPDVVRPRGPLEVAVKVAGIAAGEEAYVTLAAVDEAVLKLTEFASPAPEQYYYGKRQLGVELRDLYGRLIDPRAGGVGVLRSGGDTFAKRAVAGLPDKSSRVVALFSGLVRLDNDGAARIHLDVPDFQGQLRLMAVAFSANKLGSGVGAVTVRDPVVTLVSLPRFLAPGDTTQIGLVINNVEGAAGDYRVTFAASGAGAFTSPVERTITLATGAGFNGSFPLQARTPGNVALHLELSGPGDLKIAREFTLGVRPAQAYQLNRFVGRLEPGQSVTLDDGAAGEFLPGTAEALLTVSPRPDWDVPGLLRSLSRYPYGCIEQTTSRALPLLYVEEVARLWRSDPGYSPAAALDSAIERIAGMQRSDGSFGVWNDSDDTVPFLDAYATDFLLRAKEHGKNVPDYALNSALGWLRDYVRQQHSDEKTLPATAYAHYVLARAKRGELPALRYFNDTQLSHLPSQLAKAQVAAALAAQGDMTRANAAYAAALGPPPKRPPGLRFVDYGSDLRDSAGALAFAADNPAMKPRLTAVMDRITELFAHASRTSTQEQAWLLMAAEAAAQVSSGEMTVAVDKSAPQKQSSSLYFRRVLGAGTAPVSVANSGAAPAWRTVSITGVPQADLPAEDSGYWVGRWVFRPDGTPADLSNVKQTDLFVVVIKGRRNDSARAARALVVDLLPAGFEIASAALTGQSASNYDWLKGVSGTAYTEERDDRFIAAIDMGENTSYFTLAYVVRAVTPGEYKYPAVVAEDMYEPENTGRTAIGSLKVQPR